MPSHGLYAATAWISTIWQSPIMSSAHVRRRHPATHRPVDQFAVAQHHLIAERVVFALPVGPPAEVGRARQPPRRVVHPSGEIARHVVRHVRGREFLVVAAGRAVDRLGRRQLERIVGHEIMHVRGRLPLRRSILGCRVHDALSFRGETAAEISKPSETYKSLQFSVSANFRSATTFSEPQGKSSLRSGNGGTGRGKTSSHGRLMDRASEGRLYWSGCFKRFSAEQRCRNDAT